MLDASLAFVLSDQRTSREISSARPHAPVVPERPTRTAATRRTRIAVAGVLQRAASVVAPAECSPVR